MDKNQIRAVSHHIKTLFGLGITFIKLMLHRKKIRHMGKKKNFLNDSLLETLLLLCTKNICDQTQRKEPLDLDINQNVLVSGVIKPLFDINITSFILDYAGK